MEKDGTPKNAVLALFNKIKEGKAKPKELLDFIEAARQEREKEKEYFYFHRKKPNG